LININWVTNCYLDFIHAQRKIRKLNILFRYIKVMISNNVKNWKMLFIMKYKY